MITTNVNRNQSEVYSSEVSSGGELIFEAYSVTISTINEKYFDDDGNLTRSYIGSIMIEFTGLIELQPRGINLDKLIDNGVSVDFAIKLKRKREDVIEILKYGNYYTINGSGNIGRFNINGKNITITVEVVGQVHFN